MLCLCLAGETHQTVSPYCYDLVELELTMLRLCLGGEIHRTAISLLKNCRQQVFLQYIMRLNWYAFFKGRVPCWLWTNRYQLAVLGMSQISVSSTRLLGMSRLLSFIWYWCCSCQVCLATDFLPFATWYNAIIAPRITLSYLRFLFSTIRVMIYPFQ